MMEITKEILQARLSAFENDDNSDLQYEDLSVEDLEETIRYRAENKGKLFARLFRPSARREAAEMARERLLNQKQRAERSKDIFAAFYNIDAAYIKKF